MTCAFVNALTDPFYKRKVIKKQTNKQNKNKIKQLFDHIDLFYSTKRKTIKGTESLEITCLGIH